MRFEWLSRQSFPPVPDRYEREPKDLVVDRRAQLLLWRLPTAAIAASSVLRDSPIKAGIWTAAFTQMGLACLVNASRCGRVHCYFTGPFFLLGALASLLQGLGTLRLGWDRLGVAMLVGGVALGRLPEMIRGKYANRTADEPVPN